MSKEKTEISVQEIQDDIKQLCTDIDECTSSLLTAKGNNDQEALAKCYFRIEQLMVAVHQELSFIHGYLGKSKECFKNMDKADDREGKVIVTELLDELKAQCIAFGSSGAAYGFEDAAWKYKIEVKRVK